MNSVTEKAYKALILDDLEEYEELIQFLSCELAENPNDIILLNNRSLAYSEIGRLTEAFEDIEKAYKIDEKCDAVKYNYNSLKRHIENL